MMAALASVPLLTVLIGMTVFHRPAAQAGAVGLLVAAILTAISFDLAGAAGGQFGLAAIGTAAEAGFSTITILWIILPALMLYEFQDRTGAVARIRDALSGITTERRLQAILIAWFFGLFIEGAAGFGTPVALAAPLLVGLGYPPVRAVVLALLGHAAGVSFGAVGTPTLAQIGLTGLPPPALAGMVAMLHAALGPILLLVMVRLAGEGRLTRRDVGWSLFAALCFFIPSLALASLAGPEVPSLAGALVGALVFIAVLSRRGGGRVAVEARLIADLAPYLTIVGFILLSRLIVPLQSALASVEIAWSLPDSFRGGFAPLYHPGTLLFAGLVAAALATRRTAQLMPSLKAALTRLVPVAIALFFMLALSRLMVHSGMIATLAEAAALTGPFWPLIAPAVGVLGTFITGSATASNILFTDLHVATGAALGLPTTLMVAAQGFGSAIGNIVAPHNIIAGSATVGLVGREGEILRQTGLPALIYTLAGGAVIYILSSVL